MEPCIKGLDRWSRSYSINMDGRSQTLYPGIIDFHLKEAGSFGVRAGAHITEPGASVNIDDTPIKIAMGDYDVSTGTLSFAFCGNNVGPTLEASGINRLDGYFDDLKVRRAKQLGTPTR